MNKPRAMAGLFTETNDKATRSSLSVPRRADAVEERLRRWIDNLCDDVPLVDELDVGDLDTDCGRASLLRAALVHLRSKQPDVIRADVERELAESDLLIAVRVRQASYDLSELPWLRIHDVNVTRAEAGDVRYRGRSS